MAFEAAQSNSTPLGKNRAKRVLREERIGRDRDHHERVKALERSRMGVPETSRS